MKIVILLIALAFQANLNAADGERNFFLTGNEFIEACSQSRDVCGAFIMGVVDFSESISPPSEGSRNLCIPENATLGQLIDVVIQALTKNPQELHKAAAPQVYIYASNAFSCPD